HGRAHKRAATSDSLEPVPLRSKIDNIHHPRIKSSRARGKENKKERIRNDRPKIEMRRVELPVDHHTERDQTNDYGRSDEPVAQPDAGQSLRAGVIFRHRLQNDAPPEVSVNLDVPFVPAGIDRVAPALFLEQLENRAEQMVAISSLVAPKNPASQSATRFGVGR